MAAWFAANAGTILVLFLLLAAVAGAVLALRHDRRCGKSSCGVKCGGGCARCSGCGGRHG